MGLARIDVLCALSAALSFLVRLFASLSCHWPRPAAASRESARSSTK
jgi:hypothetical protein